jgi:predicted DNA-binding protein
MYYNLEVSMKTMLNVRLTPELGRQLEKVSKEEKIPISDIVRESLNRYVAVLRFQELQKKMIKKARKKGVFTDEDVFDIVS